MVVVRPFFPVLFQLPLNEIWLNMIVVIHDDDLLLVVVVLLEHRQDDNRRRLIREVFIGVTTPPRHPTRRNWRDEQHFGGRKGDSVDLLRCRSILRAARRRNGGRIVYRRRRRQW